jgi:drug/metabolite transporter (DMT)-like permease
MPPRPFGGCLAGCCSSSAQQRAQPDVGRGRPDCRPVRVTPVTGPAVLMQAAQPRHWVMLGYLSMMWGMAFFLIAVGLRGFTPLSLVLVRLLVGAIVLSTLLLWQRGRLPLNPVWWWRFIVLSLFGNLLPFSLITWGETRISSAQAGLLMALMPITTLLLAHFFLEHEKLTLRRSAGVLLGFLGVVILVGGAALARLGGDALIAQFAVLGATLSYASSAIYAKRLPPLDPLATAAGSLLAGCVLMTPIVLLAEDPLALTPAAGPLAAALTLGCLGTGLATWVYFRLVSDCGPGFVSITNYLIPAIAFASGVVFLDEPAAPSQFAGLFAVLLGIFLIQPRNQGATVDVSEEPEPRRSRDAARSQTR